VLEALVAFFLASLIGVSKKPWQKGADAGIRTSMPISHDGLEQDLFWERWP
jgi:hypothetical protein